MERPYRVINRIVKDFPESAEERMQAILGCINIEPKQILLGFCIDDSAKSSKLLRRIFRDYAGKSWVPGERTFSVYSHQSLVNIGVVAEEVVEYEGTGRPVTAWRITEAGKHYGRPSARFCAEICS